MKFLGHKAKNQTWKAVDFTKVGLILGDLASQIGKPADQLLPQMTSVPSNWTILPTLAVSVEKHIQKKTF